MKKLALVSVALNAVNPMMECIAKADGDVRVRNYLDTCLLEKVGEDKGKISHESMGRMLDMLVKAASDGGQCIIMTCTIFSPYAERFSGIFGLPVICPDGAMPDRVAKAGGKTAIICTFHGTVETTKAMFLQYQRKNGKEEAADMFVAPEAFRAAQISDMETHDQVIRRKISELDGFYDNIVLAQISMARAAKGVKMSHARLWTSPQSAVETAMNYMKGEADV